MRKILLIVFYTISVSLCATENTVNTGSRNYGSSVYAVGNDLPAWFFNPTGPIGVSDMYMQEDEALNQAIVRALFMYMVSEKMNLMSVYELYYHNEVVGDKNSVNEQQSHCMAAFNTKNQYLKYEIAELFYTEYDEAVVMLNVIQGSKKDRMKEARCEGEYMYYFDGAKKYPEYGDRISIVVNTPDEFVEHEEWLTKTERNIAWVYSTTDTVTNRIPEKWLYYKNGGATTSIAVSQNTRHGLWHAITDTFMQSLSNFTPRKTLLGSTNANASGISGYKDDMDYRNKVQDLTRLVFKAELSCNIVSMSIDNGVLYADWNLAETGQSGIKPQGSGNTYSYESAGYQGNIASEPSKSKNEAKRIALMFAKNEIARMAKANVASIADDFAISEEAAFYMKYCDSTQMSTNMLLIDAEDVLLEEPTLVDGFYRVRMESRINNKNVIPFIKKK